MTKEAEEKGERREVGNGYYIVPSSNYRTNSHLIIKPVQDTLSWENQTGKYLSFSRNKFDTIIIHSRKQKRYHCRPLRLPPIPRTHRTRLWSPSSDISPSRIYAAPHPLAASVSYDRKRSCDDHRHPRVAAWTIMGVRHSGEMYAPESIMDGALRRYGGTCSVTRVN